MKKKISNLWASEAGIISRYVFVGLAIYSFFKIPIENFFENFFVKELLSKVEPSWFNDIVFVVSFTATYFYTISKCKKKSIPSRNFTLMLCISVFIYFYYNFCEASTWAFTPLYFLPFIYYSDILFLVLISELFLHANFSKNKPTQVVNIFSEDEPLYDIQNDKLGYAKYAQNLTEVILSDHYKKAFAIGINGKWGTGKTSFINLVKRKIQKKTKNENLDVIEFNFDPWNSKSSTYIIQDFFNTFQKAISPYHSSLAALLIKYSNRLTDLNSSSFSKSVQSIVYIFTGATSINDLYEEINDILKKINKKIIIYIDDLDRLDKKEVIEVLRLIRNTANFYKTIFFVAYDRNYVIEAVSEYNKHEKEKFLEKIFQLEISLPAFDESLLRKELVDKLKGNEKLKIDSSLEPHFIPSGWLNTMRDVNRAYNAILLNIKDLIGEVEFTDFILIELLRMKYPDVYELVYKKKNEIFDQQNRDKGLNEGFLKVLNLVNEAEILDFLNNIFSDRTRNNSFLSIVYPSRFNLYFFYQLTNEIISEVEFSRLRNAESTQEDFNKKINKWINDGLGQELGNRFLYIAFFDNQEDFKKIIRAFFYYNNRINIDDINILNNWISKLCTPPRNINFGDTEFEAFVKDLFDNAVSPYYFECKVLKQIQERLPDGLFIGFPLDDREILAICINYLRRYMDETNYSGDYAWHLFEACVEKNGNQIIHNSEAIEIIRNYLTKNPKLFFIGIITPALKIGIKDTYKINTGLVNEIFGSVEQFEQKLKEINIKNDDVAIQEFNKFYEASKTENGVFRLVDFEFNHLGTH